MLITPRHARRQRQGYWSEAIAYTPATSRTFWLGSAPTHTPRLALRWMRTRAWDIADQLDPHAARPVHHWLTNRAEQEHALDE